MLKSDLEEIVSRLGNNIEAFAGKTIVLTGGRGFLGRYFVDLFELLNAEILDEPLRLVCTQIDTSLRIGVPPENPAALSCCPVDPRLCMAVIHPEEAETCFQSKLTV